MSRLGALLILIRNLLRGAILSGWQTARIILLRPRDVHSGLVCMEYGNLSAGGASLLAALITLTPGTTAVTIDTQRRELLLHLLDADQAESTLAEIRRDLVTPLTRWLGGAP